MFPKSIDDNLPSDLSNCMVCIFSAYRDLLRGNELNLFTYIANDEKVILDNEKNYERQLEILKEGFNKYKIILPAETELVDIPKKPSKIKLQLEKCLAGQTSDENIKLIIHALFRGNSNKDDSKLKINLAKKTKQEKFEIFLKNKINIKRDSTKK